MLCARLIEKVVENPQDFTIASCQTPCLAKLVPWAKRHAPAMLGLFHDWLVAVRETLAAAIAEPVLPPRDWARPAKIDCRCADCQSLNRFLAEPQQETCRLSARKETREHILHSVQRHKCDVTHTLDKSSSPQTLVFRKSTHDYQRTLQTYNEHRKLLEKLSEIE